MPFHWVREARRSRALRLNLLQASQAGDSLTFGRCPCGVRMNRYESKTFENQHLVLDEGVFINCVFKNCSLEYSGGDVYVQNCQGEGCQLVWRGAAQRTVFLLQGLGLMAPPTQPPAANTRVQ